MAVQVCNAQWSNVLRCLKNKNYLRLRQLTSHVASIKTALGPKFMVYRIGRHFHKRDLITIRNVTEKIHIRQCLAHFATSKAYRKRLPLYIYKME